jgi:hypothetical protein
MRSTPRSNPITVSGVTGTPQPYGQHDPYSAPQPHDPSGGWQQPFHLNQMNPTPPRRKLGTGAIIAIVIGSVAVLCIGLAAIGAAVGGGEKPTSTSTSADPDGLGQPQGAAPATTAPRGPLTVQLGETLVYTAEGLGTDDEVHYTLTAGKTITKTKYGSRPEKGQFFSLTAAVNVVKGSAYVYGGDFALVAKDGTVYEATMSHAVDGGLEGVEARTGQKVSGLIVWDIPAGVQVGAKVELRADFGGGGNQGFWQLP